MKRAVDAYRAGRVPIGIRQVGERNLVPDRGIVDDDIETPEAFRYGLRSSHPRRRAA
jgi:hypothetical protein